MVKEEFTHFPCIVLRRDGTGLFVMGFVVAGERPGCQVNQHDLAALPPMAGTKYWLSAHSQVSGSNPRSDTAMRAWLGRIRRQARWVQDIRVSCLIERISQSDDKD